jgi:hypothetical protein
MKRKFILVLAFFSLIFMAVPCDAKNIFKIGRDIIVEENQPVDSATVIGGQLTVSGLVENNIVTIGGSVVLAGSAVVRGNVFCIGGVVVQGNGAHVYGHITEVNASNLFGAISSAFYDNTDEWSILTGIIYFCFFTLLFMLALLLSFLFPRSLNAVISSVEDNKAKSFIWGVLGTMMIAPLFMLLVFSFIGIPLMPLVFSIILMAFIFGFIAASALLGKFILTKIFLNHKRSLIRETMLGLIVWWIIGWLPFYIGMIIKGAVIIIGFGGVLLAVFHHRNSWLKRSVRNSPDEGNHMKSSAV